MVRLTPVDRDTTHLILVRHGSTDANLKRPYILQGRSIDLSLNEAGREQAAAVGEFLAAYPVSAVHTSTLKRAIETAAAIAGPHGLTVGTHPELDEVDVGEWEGLDWKTIEERHPEEYAHFIADPGANPYFGGESYGDVHRRAEPKITELLEAHRGQAIVVVAHNVVNRAYLASLLGLELKHAKDINQVNTGVNVLTRRDGKTKVVTLNSFFHLQDHAF